MTFGSMVRAARKGLGLNQEALLRRMGSHQTSRAYLSKVELHNEIPSPEMVIILSYVLGINPSILIEQARKDSEFNLIQKNNKRWNKALESLEI